MSQSNMERNTLEISIISAKDLNKVNLITKMDVYVVASIVGDNSNQKIKTPVDKGCGRNPTWNFTVKFNINEASLLQNLSLVLKLKSKRVLGDKEIGGVRVSIKELLDSDGSLDTKRFVSHQVWKPDGNPKGMISFSYQFIRQLQDTEVDEVVMAYPAQQQAYGGHPPQQPGGGYGYPPRQGYRYPPRQGYGIYPPVVESAKRKNNLGRGLGVGLAGGALGGMLLTKLVADVADNNYDAGYDAGVQNGGYDGGYDPGYNAGVQDGGNVVGYDPGYNAGVQDGGNVGGYDAGYNAGVQDGGYGGGYDPGYNAGVQDGGYGGGYDPGYNAGVQDGGYGGGCDYGGFDNGGF